MIPKEKNVNFLIPAMFVLATAPLSYILENTPFMGMVRLPLFI